VNTIIPTNNLELSTDIPEIETVALLIKMD
jgi:hypothetical protein